jgi:hypothetical protein
MSTETDSQGRYIFPRVCQGHYALFFWTVGFTVSPIGKDSHIDPETRLSDIFEVGMRYNVTGPWVGVLPRAD